MRTVTVVGIGALGSHLVPLLRNEKVNLRLIDFDRVEAKNVQSQFHGKPSISKMKVEGLKSTMNFLFGLPFIQMQSFNAKLIESNVIQLLGGSDLIVDCLDNGATRRLVQNFARGGSVPCLHGALAADGAFGRIVWDERFVIDDENVTGEPTCEGGAHLPFIAIVAALLARSAQEFLVSGERLSFNASPRGGVQIF